MAVIRCHQSVTVTRNYALALSGCTCIHVPYNVAQSRPERAYTTIDLLSKHVSDASKRDLNCEAKNMASMFVIHPSRTYSTSI